MRDVTRLACYEPSNQLVFASPEGQIQANQPGEASILVRYSNQQVVARFAFVPARPNFQWPNISAENFVDRRVFNKLSALRLVPANLCLDSVFLRRAYLDCLGLLPTASDVQGFLSDNVPDKRARLIDDLLGRPEFAEFWALKWSDLLRNEEKTLDRKGVQAFHRWIRQSIADGKPLNEFARELIAARGSTYTNPPANYYRANRNALVRAETTAQIFMGIRLQCAKCHNHPFDRWTMDDYYSLTAFFARVQYKIVENNRRDGLDQHEFDGEQIVWMDRDGEVQNPRTGTRAAPRFPAIAATASPQLPPEADRLAELADWIARPDNPFFARAQVNRIWFHLMGRGIVEPIDDFRASNPAANPGLLEALASDFIEHGFDLRHCVRTIMNSRTYQLSAIPNDSNRDDTENFSRALVRPMQAEVLLDAVSQVTGVPAKFTGYPIGVRAGALPGVMVARRRESSPSPADEFLKLFGKPERLLACECERSDETTLGQAFQLISGETINHMLTSSDGRLSRLLENGRSNEDIINEFYLASLSRPPTEGEARTALEFVGRSPDRRAALEDLVWGLVNAKEFLLRQ
jgi:hypothetical protein